MLDEGEIGWLEFEGPCSPDLLAQFIEEGGIAQNRMIVLRDVVKADICDRLATQFDALIAAHGSKRGEDGFVRTQQIGATQFSHGGASYMRAVAEQMVQVLDLFSVLEPGQVNRLFLDDMLEREFARRGKIYRRAQHQGGMANFATTRKWLNNGEMALHPHEDSAQLTSAKRDGFEIATGSHTIAANICIADDVEGSETVLWNHRPSGAERRALGLEESGYPYPRDYADGFDSIRVKIRRGDLYFMNASYLHGVENAPTNNRITAGRFLTCVDDKVLSWT
ncbi:hypothetical protein LZG00_09505 [Rhodobacteraceae bacterium LMO-12]|nr:hypothetical protein [Rhodobacteraceae bacterium LMO-JJ12]